METLARLWQHSRSDKDVGSGRALRVGRGRIGRVRRSYDGVDSSQRWRQRVLSTPGTSSSPDKDVHSTEKPSRKHFVDSREPC